MPRPLVAALLASTLVLGCADQPAVTESGGISRPSLRTEQNPDGPGALVIRFAFDWFSTWDPRPGIGVTVGLLSPIADTPECGGEGPVVSDGRRIVQLLFTPNEHISQFARVHKATIKLYESASSDQCDWAGLPVFGEGTANVTFNFLSRESDGAPAVVGLKIQGIVELTGGGRALVLNTAQAHLEDDGTPIVHVDHFEIRPIGH
jgi:hypothetical protein